MVSYHFLGQTSRSNFFTNNSAHGAGQLWSHIPRLEAWGKMAMPFPLICANSRENGSQATARLGLEEVVYEVATLYVLNHADELNQCVTVDSHGVWIMGSQSFCHGRHDLRWHHSQKSET